MPSARAGLPYLPPLALLAAWPWAYRFVCDDAFISFRYARNLLRGEGLVFNPGEWVEGYTNLAWVLEVAAIWGLTGLRPEVSSVVLGFAMTLALGGVVVALARRTPDPVPAVPVAALTLLATNRSVAVWATSGLETRQFTLLVTAATLALSRWRRGRRWVLGGALLLGGAELTRPEALLFGPALLGAVTLHRAHAAWAAEGRAGLRRAPAWLVDTLPFVGITVAHLLWRQATYGEWLPNTYHAKHVRPWWDAGVRFWGTVTIEHALWLVVPLAVLGAVVRLRRTGDGALLYPWAWMVPHAVHTLQLGGDHFEWRMLDPYWPILTVGSAQGVAALAHRLHWSTWRRRFGLGIGIVVLYQAAIPLAHDRLAFARHGRSQTFDMAVDLTPSNSPWVWALPPNALWMGAYDRWSGWLATHSIANRHREHQVFSWLMRGWFEPYRPWEDAGLFPDDAVSAESALGAYGYFLADLVVIDKKGLADHHIARTEVTTPNDHRRMAHDRSPPPGYLASRGYNLEVEPFEETLGAAFRRAPWVVELAEGAFMPLRGPDPEAIREMFADRTLHARREARHRLSPAASPGPAPRDTVSHEGRTWRRIRTVAGFDTPTAWPEGWSTDGGAFALGPAGGTRLGQAPVQGVLGTGLVNTWDVHHHGRGRGQATSPPLALAAGQALTFLVGGGAADRVGVVVQDRDGRPVGTWRGAGDTTLRRVVVPVTEAHPTPWRVVLQDRGGRDADVLLVDDLAVLAP